MGCRRWDSACGLVGSAGSNVAASIIYETVYYICHVCYIRAPGTAVRVTLSVGYTSPAAALLLLYLLPGLHESGVWSMESVFVFFDERIRWSCPGSGDGTLYCWRQAASKLVFISYPSLVIRVERRRSDER